MKDLFAGSVQLASPPELFVRLTQTMDDPQASLGDVAGLIERDPAIAARLLKIANSAFYGLPSKLVTVSQAIGLIGYQEIRDLVLATVVVDRFPALPDGLMSMRQFWTMSVRIALTAKLLSAHHPEGKRLGVCFICGLLHEIGRLVIYLRIPELARDALLLARSEELPELAAERRTMGFDHYQVGVELARRWRLPEVIQVTIETHENAELAGTYREEAQIVTLSRYLSQLDLDENPATSALPAEALPLWNELAPHTGSLEALLGEANQQFDALFAQIYGRRA